jgi:chromosome partitioning protein
MARIIAVVSQKGGVGKTTTAVNLAAAFAREGREVLLMEIDPQGAVLPSVGCEDTDVRHSLADVLLDEQIPALSAVLSTPFDGISVVPAIRPSGSQEIDLQRVAMDHPLVLREVMDQLAPRYDVVLVDCPPTLGPLMRLCLAASDSFLVPVQAEEYSYRTLERLLETTDEVRQTLNPDLECEGLLLTMVDLRTRMSVRVVNQLHENYGDKVLMGMVPRTVTLQEMPVRGRPTVVHAGSSRGGKAYTEVARELLVNFDPVEPDASSTLVEEQAIPSTMIARQGEAAVQDTRSLEEIGHDTMISSFPSTYSDNGSITNTRWGRADDDFEAWGDDESDRTIN